MIDKARGWIYFVSGDEPEPVKIGFTKNAPEGRCAEFQIGNPRKLRVLGSFRGDETHEGFCHETLKDFRVRGEWFEREAALDLLIAIAPERGKERWEYNRAIKEYWENLHGRSYAF